MVPNFSKYAAPPNDMWDHQYTAAPPIQLQRLCYVKWDSGTYLFETLGSPREQWLSNVLDECPLLRERGNSWRIIDVPKGLIQGSDWTKNHHRSAYLWNGEEIDVRSCTKQIWWICPSTWRRDIDSLWRSHGRHYMLCLSYESTTDPEEIHTASYEESPLYEDERVQHGLHQGTQ
jgi:hypothetical protein